MVLTALCPCTRAGTSKMLLIMKISAMILLTTCLTASAGVYSQKVTLTEKNAALETVFTAIKKQTGFTFLYKDKVLQVAKKITIEVRNVPLQRALDICFAGQPLVYSIINNTVVVKLKNEKPDIKDEMLFADISGKIANENGEPVIATVLVKGTTIGTTSNAEGFFELKNIGENATLIISGIGVETMEIKVAGRNSLDIRVKVKADESEAVMVNAGYYSVRNIERTGSISRVDSRTIEKQPVTNVLNALQGRMPGVVITQRTGVPGGSVVVQIRGQNSLRADGNFPLYVIDGLPVDSRPIASNGTMLFNGIDPLSTLNPADISSIEVLKDADATSIYGSRGANGVILVTTKKGRSGKTGLDVNIYKGAGRVLERMDLLNTEQYLAMRREAFTNMGTNPGAADHDLNGTWDQDKYTDWQDLLFGGTSSMLDAQASLSGGNDLTSFRLGGSFRRETTVFPGDFKYDRATGMFNINHHSRDHKFRVVLSANYSIDHNDLFNASVVDQALMLPPNAPLFNQDGSLDWRGYNATTKNPFAEMYTDFNTSSRRFMTNASLSYELFRGLVLKTSLGYTDMRTDESILTPEKSLAPLSGFESNANKSNNTSFSWIAEPQLIYHRNIGKGKLDVLVGTTWQQNTSGLLRVHGTGFISDELLDNIAAARTQVVMSDIETDYKYSAIFGRIGYNYKDKYIINLTARRDGSSRFGPGRQFANFGAIGAAWIFSSEDFIRQLLPVMSFGKLRASYGTTGSDQVGDYSYLSTFTPNSALYQNASTIDPVGLANPDYAWEINKKFEISLETGFFNDRLSVIASWYRNRSSNQLVGYPLSAITGFTSVQANFDATVQNTGWEFEVFSKNIVSARNGWQWSTSLNLTIPKNKLVAYPNLQGSSYANTYVIGQPLSIRKMYHVEGVDPVTGFYRVVDVDGNGSMGTADRQTIIDNARLYFGGINNSISYKSWQLSFLVEYVNQLGRGYQALFTGQPGSKINQPVMVLERWQKPGDITHVQKFTTSGLIYSYISTSDYNLEDASFLRLRNVSLSYSLPAGIIQKIRASECRIYLQAQNLLTITSYSGMNPENYVGSLLPPLQVITAGMQIKF